MGKLFYLFILLQTFIGSYLQAQMPCAEGKVGYARNEKVIKTGGRIPKYPINPPPLPPFPSR